MANKQDYIIFCSDQCHHCEEFLTELYKKNIELYKKFLKVDVGKNNIRIPPYVQSVPTIVVPIKGKKTVLTDDQAFEWLYNINGKSLDSNSAGQIMDYDPIGMSGFSDGFASFNDNEPSPMDKSFVFINRNNDMLIPTPPENDESNKDKLRNEQSGRALEELKAARDREIPTTLQRQ
jgi:hypothetical protein